MAASRIIKDLTNVPEIVAGLGLSVAAAQSAFNLDYINSIERLLVMIRAFYGATGLRHADGTELNEQELAQARERFEEMKGAVMDLLKALAPSRYQFTETTLSVKLDLAQTMDVAAGGALGFGYGGVAVNASIAIGFGQEYRGAAEVTARMHAIPADPAAMSSLIERLNQLDAKGPLEMPEPAQIDAEILEATARIYEKMVGALPPKIELG